MEALFSVLDHEVQNIVQRCDALDQVFQWLGGPWDASQCSPRSQHDAAIGIMNLLAHQAFDWTAPELDQHRLDLLFQEPGIWYRLRIAGPFTLAIDVAYSFGPGVNTTGTDHMLYHYNKCKWPRFDQVMPRKLAEVLKFLYWECHMYHTEAELEMAPFPWCAAPHHAQVRKALQRYIEREALDICGEQSKTPRGVGNSS
jgi:hypothetical protein